MTTPSIIVTNHSITVVFFGESPKVITADHANFAKCKEAIKRRDWAGLKKNIDIESSVRNYVSGDVRITDGVITYKGEQVHNLIVERIMQFMRDGMPFEPLVKFLDNLMKNPSYRARQELYKFLEHEALPITEDGHFLAYKAVQHNWMDIYSGTVYNGIGTVVRMQRHNVDDDCNHGCSKGLHAGSIEYVRGYGLCDSRYLIVKINPEHVVSVPSEDSRKLRTCEYVVLSEFKDKLTKSCYNSDGSCMDWDIDEDDVNEDIDADDDDFYDDDDCDCSRCCRRN